MAEVRRRRRWWSWGNAGCRGTVSLLVGSSIRCRMVRLTIRMRMDIVKGLTSDPTYPYGQAHTPTYGGADHESRCAVQSGVRVDPRQDRVRAGSLRAGASRGDAAPLRRGDPSAGRSLRPGGGHRRPGGPRRAGGGRVMAADPGVVADVFSVEVRSLLAYFDVYAGARADGPWPTSSSARGGSGGGPMTHRRSGASAPMPRWSRSNWRPGVAVLRRGPRARSDATWRTWTRRFAEGTLLVGGPEEQRACPGSPVRDGSIDEAHARMAGWTRPAHAAAFHLPHLPRAASLLRRLRRRRHRTRGFPDSPARVRADDGPMPDAPSSPASTSSRPPTSQLAARVAAVEAENRELRTSAAPAPVVPAPEPDRAPAPTAVGRRQALRKGLAVAGAAAAGAVLLDGARRRRPTAKR